MEGYLKKWVNVFQRWQLRYFILNEDVLVYCDAQNTPIKGQVHLKVSGIILMPEDPLRIIINTGTSEINLRAASITEKINWVNALKAAQDKSLDRQNPIEFDQRIQDLLSDAHMQIRQVDETMSLLIPKLEKNSQIKEMAERLETLGKNLKNKITLCSCLIEEEKAKLQEMQQLDNDTIFESFANRSERVMSIGDDSLQMQLNGVQMLGIDEIASKFKSTQPIKYRNIATNPVYSKIKFSTANQRDHLPFRKDPNEKLNIWGLIKELIGKDLTRFAVPIILNEPLSMLQRLAEQMEYADTLIHADRSDDSGLRMCYVMAFSMSAYSSNAGRFKKPFNPILGETYELSCPEFRFISEQVSHHPPISAGYAESDQFQFWTHTDIHSKFYGNHYQVNPLGNLHVILKKSNDHYVSKKCTTKLQNLLWGQQYLDHSGEMKFSNSTNGDFGVLELLEKSGKNLGEMRGWVKNANKVELYTLKGNWNEKLVAKRSNGGPEVVVWRKGDMPAEYNWNYFFTRFAMQLNHLSVDLIQSLPCTDCRLRPDQLAMEHGWIDLAAQEKNRLEEKQRARRNQMAQANQEHIPRFFEEQIDPNTQEKWFKYRGNYFDWKKSGEEGLDLF